MALCNYLLDPQKPDDMVEAERLNGLIVQKALEVGGTCAGEHGVGIHKIQFMNAEHGLGAIELMQKIKNAFDSNHILNPGKILPKPQ